KPRHAVVDPPRQLADFGMQRPSERDVHFLQAATDAEQRDAAGDAGFRQRQRDIVAKDIVGFMALMRLGPEPRRMDIGTGAGQDDAVDGIEQRTDIGDLGRAREHQRQRTCDFRDRAEIPLADHLGSKSVFDAMGVSNHTDDGPSHRSTFTISGKHILCPVAIPDQYAVLAQPRCYFRVKAWFASIGSPACNPAALSAVAAASSDPFSHGSFATMPRVTGSPSQPPKSSGQRPFGTTSTEIGPR